MLIIRLVLIWQRHTDNEKEIQSSKEAYIKDSIQDESSQRQN